MINFMNFWVHQILVIIGETTDIAAKKQIEIDFHFYCNREKSDLLLKLVLQVPTILLLLYLEALKGLIYILITSLALLLIQQMSCLYLTTQWQLS